MTEIDANLDASRTMVRLATSVTLASLAPTTGYPLATLATMATDFDGSPILLLSALSIHTRALTADSRCALLLTTPGKGDPLAHPRLTLVGNARKSADYAERGHWRARFLAQNPKAARYADFSDFDFWRVDLVSAHLNGGFARAADYAARALLVPNVPGLAEAEPALLAAINRDEAQAFAERAGAPGQGWRAIALDGAGLTLAAGDKRARLAFSAPALKVADIIAALRQNEL